MLAPFEVPMAALAARVAEALVEPLTAERVRYQISLEQHAAYGICQWCEPQFWAIIAKPEGM